MLLILVLDYFSFLSDYTDKNIHTECITCHVTADRFSISEGLHYLMNSVVAEYTVTMTVFMTTNEPSLLLILPNIFLIYYLDI